VQVRMTTDHRIALDGINVSLLAEGSTHDLPAATAERLAAEQKAELAAAENKDAGAAPENKAAAKPRTRRSAKSK
jgi:hypothetical protein